ncbi:MAG: hypothetical protein WB555_00285 [Candidatus Korobacteraceae bacterium]
MSARLKPARATRKTLIGMAELKKLCRAGLVPPAEQAAEKLDCSAISGRASL